MTVEQMTARINELYHKSQAEGLSEAEKEEQSRLRQAYVANVRANLRGQLNQISIVEKDGSITNLGDKESKDSVRIRSLKRRDALTKQDRTRYSQEIVQQVITLSCYQEADILLAYASYRSEVETYGLIRQALSDNKLVFVPRVEGQDMEFYQIQDLSCLHDGYRGIPEPAPDSSYPDCLVQNRLTSSDSILHVLLCMPGAAFDKARHRIGYGGGFYDRYLEKTEIYQNQGQVHLTTAALAYSCQIWDQIPWESHDVIPDIVMTEKGGI